MRPESSALYEQLLQQTSSRKLSSFDSFVTVGIQNPQSLNNLIGAPQQQGGRTENHHSGLHQQQIHQDMHKQQQDVNDQFLLTPGRQPQLQTSPTGFKPIESLLWPARQVAQGSPFNDNNRGFGKDTHNTGREPQQMDIQEQQVLLSQHHTYIHEHI